MTSHLFPPDRFLFRTRDECMHVFCRDMSNSSRQDWDLKHARLIGTATKGCLNVVLG